MITRALACMAILMTSSLLGGCSSSLGDGGEQPSRTYVVVPNGTAVPVTPAPSD